MRSLLLIGDGARTGRSAAVAQDRTNRAARQTPRSRAVCTACGREAIGPRHQDMMGDTYDVRSDVEHLHENKHLEGFNRATRLELVKKLEMMEYIMRSALVRIVLEPKLWPHFANTTALQAFWALDDQQKRALWGSIINPTDALADFDPRYISNAQLGGP